MKVGTFVVHICVCYQHKFESRRMPGGSGEESVDKEFVTANINVLNMDKSA